MIEQKTNTSKAAFHLAGIVPVAGQKLDFEFDWHDSLMPIAQNYLAVERAVVECAYAGCETIWVVCHEDMTPLIRHRMGEWIHDPIWYHKAYDSKPKEQQTPIPIYYVPIHPKDRDRRDCLGWSALYGSLTAFWISKQSSNWVTPDRYYVAFPYGVYPPEIVRPYRKQISSTKGFFLKYFNNTVQQEQYLGFTFDAEDFVNCRRHVRKEGTGQWISNGDKIPTETLPVEERWSARHFSLDKVFKSVKIDNTEFVEVPWYFNIDNWDGYCRFLGSKERYNIKRPYKNIFKYREWSGTGVETNEHNE